MLAKCNSRQSPIERFKAVVAWNISILRPLTFGVAPYNPILGETHHASRGTLNVLTEQISHHPPVTALHATDEKENLEIIWCQHPVPKFSGTSVEAEVRGKRELKLLNHGETYVMNSPSLIFKFFPPGVEWGGNDRIRCHETGLEAELTYGGRSFLGLRGTPRSIKGKIFDSSLKKPLFEINGQWDRTVTLKDLNSGEVKVLYNAKEVISKLQIPIVKDPKGVWPSESAIVWSEVSQGILSKDWGKAREAKKAVEEKQRELLRDRKSKSEIWVPKHFNVSYSKENGWECSPIEMVVPPAPIVVPLKS
ncbi:Oxysterol-binding protein [Parasponia andersonii]|uniref:Oxysterol-binding protein n=1 Tax=Parasponia andersonii TaxID=3476 RepID=A0A2P5BJH2_PARAD|nr:Oxysterol-binding protein [Parasponia andersonii]